MMGTWAINELSKDGIKALKTLAMQTANYTLNSTGEMFRIHGFFWRKHMAAGSRDHIFSGVSVLFLSEVRILNDQSR